MTFKTIKIKNKRTLNSTSVNQNKNLILLAGLFICGIIIGAGTVGKSENYFYVMYEKVFNVFYNWQCSTSFFKLFISVFVVISIFYLNVIFLGQSGLGIPVIFLFDILFGLMLGMFSGVIIKKYGITGMEYYSLIIIPFAVTSALSYILLSDCALESSEQLLKFILNSSDNNNFEVKQIVSRNIKYYILTVFSALIFSFCSVLFIKLFSF